MNEKRATDDELAEEVKLWDSGEITPSGWEEAPDAVPRAKESTQVNIRLPCRMVETLKEFAHRSGVGYQVLMKRWLNERIQVEGERFRQEQERFRRERERLQNPPTITLASPTFFSQAVVFDASEVSDVALNPPTMEK